MMQTSLRFPPKIVATLLAVVMSNAGLSAADCVRFGAVRPEPEVVLLSAAVQVFDQSRKPLPGVIVALSGGDLKIPAHQANSKGYVTFRDVPPGKYRLDVRLQGFVSFERDIRISRTEKRAGRLLAVLLVVAGECAESRFCALVGGDLLDVAPLCTISPNAYWLLVTRQEGEEERRKSPPRRNGGHGGLTCLISVHSLLSTRSSPA